MKKTVYFIGFFLLLQGIVGCKHGVDIKKTDDKVPAKIPVEGKEKTVVKTEKEAEVMNETTEKKLEKGTYAMIKVTHGGEDAGEIVVRLYPDKTPITVQNFVGLAQGTKEFDDMATGQKKKARFYDGIIFHRIIDGFMIQAGDPTGTGRGGPGYKFGDEIVSELQFNKPGLLAMANAGPGTNGSQFFITVAATPWLNGKHTIFGEVVEGMDVVMKIAKVPTGAGDKPVKPVAMEKVDIKVVE